jgi:predicted Zn-ribbon and HTH transcriptional regulator
MHMSEQELVNVTVTEPDEGIFVLRALRVSDGKLVDQWTVDSRTVESGRDRFVGLLESYGSFVKARTCLQCGHRWQPRTSALPRYCPSCRSHRWDRAAKS